MGDGRSSGYRLWCHHWPFTFSHSPHPNHQQTLLALPSKIGFLLTSFPATPSVPATSISCLDYCNHLLPPWFSPCILLSILKIIAGVMLLKPKSDCVAPLLKILQWSSVSLNIKAKSLQCPTKVYMLWTLASSLMSSPATLPLYHSAPWTNVGSHLRNFSLRMLGVWEGAGWITRLRFMPFEICRHEFKVRPIDTVVCSL